VEEGKLSDRDQLSFGDMPATFYLSSPMEASRKNTAPVPPPAASLPAPAAVGAKAPVPAPPVVARRPVAVGAASRQPAAYRKEGGGCAAFFVLIFFVILAFLIGLSIRHYKETGSMNLPMDVYKKYQSQQRKAPDDKAADKPAPTSPAPAKPSPSNDKGAASPGEAPAGAGAMESK